MHDLPLVDTIAAGLTAALLLGLATQRLGLSPIVGYLLAGIAIGPFTPGFVGDVQIASQLAEIGVILLMFGVGLNFHLKDMITVQRIAVPGALLQITLATAVTSVLVAAMGWKWSSGIVLGIAISVASTVVLIRMLRDNRILDTSEGKVAIGWLVLEDIVTVIVLVLLPTFARELAPDQISRPQEWLISTGWAILKLSVFVAAVLLLGSRFVPWLMVSVARFRSRELFTLTVLVMAIAVAAFAYHYFGASMALGAFLAGMVVGQSTVSHEAAANALPLSDAFSVLFFVSVGMLFDPSVLWNEPALFLSVLGVILLVKPLAAMAAVFVLKYSLRTALIVAVGLAQIGEFSFILAELGRSLQLLPESGYSVLVACSIFSIAINPILFRGAVRLEKAVQGSSRFKGSELMRGQADPQPEGDASEEKITAIVVGYGPVGRTVNRLLQSFAVHTIIVELNVDTVKLLHSQGQTAIFGDASNRHILLQANVQQARYVIVTLPDAGVSAAVVTNARNLNPDARILVRARYLGERKVLERAGATDVRFEEAEIAISLSLLILSELNAKPEEFENEIRRIRKDLTLED
jgi:CPA2 family monovalent cation:H+ antiporter-2